MSFENGVKKGKKLIEFIRDVMIRWDTLETFNNINFGCSTEKIDKYWRQFPNHSPSDEFSGFLSTIIPNDEVDAQYVKLMPFEEFYAYNEEYAPLCNFPSDIGVSGFAYWMGESDGDAWVLDLNDNSIFSVYVGSYGESYQDLLESSYNRFSTLEAWIDFLRNEADLVK